jgi:hypothetical protein
VTEASVRDLLGRYVQLLNARDFDGLRQILDPDYVEEYPQSGERIRGPDALVAVLAAYPGGLGSVDADRSRVVGSDEHWLMTPTFTTLRVTGSGDIHTILVKARGSDDTEWHVIGLVRLRNGRIWRATYFFAPEFEAPEWRVPHVERFDRSRHVPDA